MKSWLRLVAIVTMAALSFGVASAADAPTATLAGVVSDASGAPLAGARVEARGRVDRVAISDAKGAYTIAGLPVGLYDVTVRLSGYSPASEGDIAVATGMPALNVTLTAESLSSLRTIASVRTTGGSSFNYGGQALTTLSSQAIAARVQPNLTNIVAELPGVSVSRDTGRTPNTNFVIRGSSIETKVTVNGHAVSSGVFGTWNSNYANSEIFSQVEVLKGAGLNGVNAGEGAVGTVNLRTRDFSPHNEVTFSLAMDGYGSGYYGGHISYSFLKNDRLSVLLARTYQGYQGPDEGLTEINMQSTGGALGATYNGPSLTQWQGDFSNRYWTSADLYKMRYKLSTATWITGEFLNLTGRYSPQGGSYGIYYGNRVVPQCYNGAAFVGAGQAGCTVTSTYNNPLANGLIGTTQPQYGFFPNSSIINNEPQYSFELRTTFKNDTLLLRPYTALIKRFIDGTFEDYVPGNAGAWFQVTNPANCQVVFANPTVPNGGAKGPCFSSGNGYSMPYVGAVPNPGTPTVFPTTTTAPGCSVATPCYTTPTAQQANGVYAYGTPFSQPEVDRLHGISFSWVHPVGDNVYTAAFDYNSDYTTKYSGDTSPLPVGCQATLSSVANAGANAQPACQVGGVAMPFIPRVALQIPPTTNYKYDYALTGLWQLTPKLQVGLGNYISMQRLDYQYTDPVALAAHPDGGAFALATLLHGSKTTTHYDPHLQLVYRATGDLSFRATAGSGVTFPYNGLISGFTALVPNGGPDGHSDVLTVKNPDLRPETTVAYNVGFDYRAHNGAVWSGDYFNNTIHDVFITNTALIPTPAQRAAVGVTNTYENTTLNGPLQRSYGLEMSGRYQPEFGTGWYATLTLNRAYYDGFGQAFYQYLSALAQHPAPAPPVVPGFSPFVNGKQLDNTGGFTGSIPYFKGAVEVSQTFRGNHARFALGDAFEGANNAVGGKGYGVMYANYNLPLSQGLSVLASAQNLLNFNSGTFIGQARYATGISPIGERWNPVTNTLEFGPVFGTPNNTPTVAPANLYIMLTKKF